jgi:hypothetical protein
MLLLIVITIIIIIISVHNNVCRDADVFLKSTFFSVEFEVLTAVVMKCSVFWDITPCCSLRVTFVNHPVIDFISLDTESFVNSKLK